jgi:hypothetical protein
MWKESTQLQKPKNNPATLPEQKKKKETMSGEKQ